MSIKGHWYKFVTCFSHDFTYILIRFIIFHILSIGSVYCTNDISNPTPVYVVEGGEAVLQCGFESSRLRWMVYNGVVWNTIASGSDVIESSKY